MSEPFLGQIQMFAFNFPPKGWAACNGQLMPIQQNTALFSILGTAYGGNGQTTFALPDLRGRTPVHWGNGTTLGQAAGEESHTLTTNELPAHVHAAMGSDVAADQRIPVSNTWAKSDASAPYSATANATLSPVALGSAGNSQPHENRQPYLVMNFCIATQGIFPSRN